jgi:hypothetical protein
MARPPTGQIIERDGARGRTFGLRFRAHGKRHYITAAASTRAEAEEELERTLAAVKLGIWKPPEPEPAQLEPEPTPTLHAFASAWVERNRGGVGSRTVEFWT